MGVEEEKEEEDEEEKEQWEEEEDHIEELRVEEAQEVKIEEQVEVESVGMMVVLGLVNFGQEGLEGSWKSLS